MQNDKHLLTVLKYIERNAVRAKLCSRAENWKWGSAHHRQLQDVSLLSESPVILPVEYLNWINIPEQAESLKEVRQSVEKGLAYGGLQWQQRIIQRYSMSQALRIDDGINIRT